MDRVLVCLVLPKMNEAFKRLRALKFIELRLRGKTHTAIGLEFGVSDQTVQRALDWAARIGLMESFEDQILNDLVPVAMKTLKKAMAEGNDSSVALEVFKGIGLFKKHSDKTISPSAGEESLDDYLSKKRITSERIPDGTLPSQPASRGLPPASPAIPLDGQLLEAAPAVPADAEASGFEIARESQLEDLEESLGDSTHSERLEF